MWVSEPLKTFAFASVLLQLFRKENVCVRGLRINTYTNKINFYHKAKQKQNNKEKIQNSFLTPALRKTRGHWMLGSSLQDYASADRPCCSQHSMLSTWAFNFKIQQDVQKPCHHVLCTQIEPLQSPLSKTLWCIILDTKN